MSYFVYFFVHAKRYKLVKIFKNCFFSQKTSENYIILNHLLGVFTVSYYMKLINDVTKGNHYGDNIRCFFYQIFMRNTSKVCNRLVGFKLH